MEQDFVVQVRNVTMGKIEYYATDDMSGGYPYFTPWLSSAALISHKDAQQVIKDFKRPNKSNGWPNELAHNAAGINNKVSSTTLEVSIGTIQFVPELLSNPERILVQNRSPEVEAQKKVIAIRARAKLSVEEIEALGLK